MVGHQDNIFKPILSNTILKNSQLIIYLLKQSPFYFFTPKLPPYHSYNMFNLSCHIYKMHKVGVLIQEIFNIFLYIMLFILSGIMAGLIGYEIVNTNI